MSKWCVYVIVFLMACTSVTAQESSLSIIPATADDFTSPLQVSPRPISLDEVITFALQNNLGIEIVNYDRRIAGHEVGAESGIFDPHLYLAYQRSESEEKSLTAIDTINHDTQKFFVGSLQQLLPTGAVVNLSYNMLRHYSENNTAWLYNPYYSNKATLTAKQPLLKNAGSFVTRAGIRIAIIGEKIAEDNYRNTILNVLTSTIKAYWDLVFVIQNYEVEKIALKQAEDLLRTNKAKYDAGVIAATDVLQAEAEVAARKDQLLQAERQIFFVSDNLKKLLNIPQSGSTWEITLVPQDPLKYQQVFLEEEESYLKAVDNRPDYAALQKQKDISDINQRVAKNRTYPEVNIFGSYGFSGTDDSFSSSHSELGTLDYNNWSAGVEFAFPLLNRTARHRYKQSQLRVQQTQTALRDLEQSIRLQVRDAIRNADTNLKRIFIARTRIEFEQAKLRDEFKRYEVGVTTVQDILRFQTDLANARAQYLLAVTEYLKSLVELQRVTGTLLDDLNIMIEPKS